MKRWVLVGLIAIAMVGCKSESKTELAYEARDGIKTTEEVDLAIAKGPNAKMLFPTRDKARAFAISSLSMAGKEGEELAAALDCQHAICDVVYD